ncbi:hypothetical protein B0H10DRAFT_1771180 [Mycena sp. CBHHK59/15]|nr:hypothetical protein B0H10DRAFT_1771180 [Mycena sp. CBHHK59/15]
MKRVPELWFKDGNLVLCAGHSMFRVYGGLLADRSPIFDDMLEIPQPQDAELVDGCPVVHLPDNENDLEFFLNALIDYEFFLPFPTPTDFDTLSGILRLATKYLVEPLRKRALAHLSSAFPLILNDYRSSPSWSIADEEYIRVILLARELSIDWILPVALYRRCDCITPEQFLNGVHHDNTRLELTTADKTVYLLENPRLRGHTTSAVLNFLWDPPVIPGCKSELSCSQSRTSTRQGFETWRNSGYLPLTIWGESDWDGLGVCKSCLSAMKVVHAIVLQKFWDGLPERFGFPGWADLQEMRDNALA